MRAMFYSLHVFCMGMKLRVYPLGNIYRLFICGCDILWTVRQPSLGWCSLIIIVIMFNFIIMNVC